MTRAKVVKLPDVVQRRNTKIENPENYTVIHAIKKEKERRAKERAPSVPGPFNGIRGLERLAGR